MSEKIKTTVIGAAGRMGRQIIKEISSSEKFKLIGAIEDKNSKFIGEDAFKLAEAKKESLSITHNLIDAVVDSNVLIDFSSINSTLSAIELSAQSRITHVIGTTGFSNKEEDLIKAAARHATIIKSGNMSLGVNALLGILKKASQVLDPNWSVEITEVHHKEKKDHPSGTALEIGKAVSSGRNINLEDVIEISDPINVNEDINLTAIKESLDRKKGKIGFSSYRKEGVVGDHSVIFDGENERIALSHIAENRDIFAKGALKAAEWGQDKEPGLFSMIDVLGF